MVKLKAIEEAIAEFYSLQMPTDVPKSFFIVGIKHSRLIRHSFSTSFRTHIFQLSFVSSTLDANVVVLQAKKKFKDKCTSSPRNKKNYEDQFSFIIISIHLPCVFLVPISHLLLNLF